MPDSKEEIQFDWIQLRNDMGSHEETQKEKFMRKFGENPFVPIGALATAAALCTGLYSFRAGKRRLSQYMMRTRVVAQGLTVFALIFGVAVATTNTTKKTDGR